MFQKTRKYIQIGVKKWIDIRFKMRILMKIQRTSLIAPRGDDELEIPEAIERIMNSGVKFRQSIGSWKIDDEKVTVRKSYSVYFTLDTQVPIAKIIEALDSKEIEYEDILSIQRRLGTNTYVVSFRTAEGKQQILSSWDIMLLLLIVTIRFLLLKYEMPDSVIIGRLSVYGSVLSFRRDLASENVFNGIRTA